MSFVKYVLATTRSGPFSMKSMSHGPLISLFSVPGGSGSPLKIQLKRPKQPELGVLSKIKNKMFALIKAIRSSFSHPRTRLKTGVSFAWNLRLSELEELKNSGVSCLLSCPQHLTQFSVLNNCP